MSRLDLVTRQLQPWCDARFDVFARDFDGLTWFVALRRRQEVERGKGNTGFGAISPNGEFIEWHTGPDGDKARMRYSHGWQELPVDGRGVAGVLCLTRDWAVLSTTDGQDTAAYLLDCAGRKLRAPIDLKLKGPGVPAGRIQGERLLIYDRCGRLLLLSLKSGAVLQEHRLP